MTVQLDTNILTRLAQPSHPVHNTLLAAKNLLESAGNELCVVPQNFFEFWVVATRPVMNNGLGLTVAEAKSELDVIKKSFLLFRDPSGLLEAWEAAVLREDCKGKPAHDARIVAAMNLHGVKQILTFNTSDFKRFSEITVLDPFSVASSMKS